MVERDIRLVAELRESHPHLHVAHTSTAAALAAVRQARRNGLRVTCEVAPHHFLLTEEHVGLYNTHAKMNPPLRSAADRDAMIEGILDGVVDAIATDHAPHAMHEKEIEFELAPNGITGLETALGLCLRWLHGEWKMPLGRVLSLLSAQPAALLGLKGRGTLAVGSFADVVVFDPKAEWTYRATESKSKAKNTPFDGWPMLGKVRWTVSEGRVAYAGYVSRRASAQRERSALRAGIARHSHFSLCSPFAAVKNLKFVAGIGGKKRGHVAQALGEGGRGQQRILALAQVVIVEVDGERKHVDGERIGEGRLEETHAGALVDARAGWTRAESIRAGGHRARVRLQGAAAGFPCVLAGFAAHLRFGLRPGEREKLSGTPADSTKLCATLMKNSKARALPPSPTRGASSRPPVAIMICACVSRPTRRFFCDWELCHGF